MKQTKKSGFSFVEVVLALALVAGAMVTLMAMVPVGLKASHEAKRRTITGHILEDVHERLEGNPLKDGPLESGPLFYDDEGVFVGPNSSMDRIDRRMFRVDVRIEKPADPEISKRAPGLMAVILEVGWPVDPNGVIISIPNSKTRASVSYFVNTLTGPGWKEIDNQFEPLIEY